MTVLYFLWYLVALPYDRHVCDLWVSAPPDNPAIVQACGLQVAANLSAYQLRAIDLREEVTTIACDAPADTLLALPCDLYPLDNYRLEIWKLGISSEMLCNIELEHSGLPSRLDVIEQCDRPEALERYDKGQTKFTLIGQYERIQPDPAPVCTLPDPSTGRGLTQTPLTAFELATDKPYALLAGRLIWYGYVRPACEGGLSGLDPVTLAPTGCGMAAARATGLIAWQNQFDEDILQAARDSQAPAMLLKAIIAAESQFWPFWEPPAGEVSIVQITVDGFDMPLRYDADLYASACPLALDPARCKRGYHGLTEWEQEHIRYALRDWFRCHGCSVEKAVEKMRADIYLYARILRAWRCYAGQTIPGANDPWRLAAAAYHAGGSCISQTGICPEGDKYLRKLEQ